MITLSAKIAVISDSGTLNSVLMSDGYNYYYYTDNILGKINSQSSVVGHSNANQNGVFDTSYTLTLTGLNISVVCISFDIENDRYPTSITVDGTVYNNNSSIFFKNVTSSNSHTIIISSWNEPNYPLVITGITNNIVIEFGRKNMLSIERNLYDRQDISLPSFGVISNNGKMSFTDADTIISIFAETGLLKKGQKIQIYVNKTEAKRPIDFPVYFYRNELIGEYVSDDWAYDAYSREINLTFKDDLEEWQDIKIQPLYYTPNVSTSMTGIQIYDYLYSQTPNKYNMLTSSLLDTNTYALLSAITIQYPILEEDNLWASWDKFCNAFQLHIYKENGRTICRYNGGN